MSFRLHNRLSLRVWSITDNVMIAFEVLYTITCNINKKQGEITLKIDISKAYDTVSWYYLRTMMFKLGFLEQWVG